jgi:hypothetical protein
VTRTRRFILAGLAAISLLSSVAASFAQVPAPVPALPNSERRTSYSLKASTCACTVNMALYGDSNDCWNWIEVFLNGVRVNYNDATFGWTITSPSGSLSGMARPITDAVLTFTSAQTGTVQIVGARRPRRVSQYNEGGGVPTRNFNRDLTDIIATERETWDKINDVTGRAVLAPPGETLNLLSSKSSSASQGACFDSGGNLVSCIAIPSTTMSAGAGILFTGTGPTVISANIAAGNGIAITGTNPVTITNNIQAGSGVTITGTNPQIISAPTVQMFTTLAATTSGSGANTTGTISAGSPTLTLAAAIDFANGQGIRINHAGAAFTLNSPTAGSVTPTGTAGSTAYAYIIVSLNATGGVGPSSASVTTSTGNATLSSTNYNAISWTAATGTAPAAYAVYGRTAGSFTLLGIVNGTTFNDTGGGTITAPDWLPPAPAGPSLASWLITTISSGAGTTALTLAANATTAVTSQYVIHDDTANLQAWITAAETAGNVAFLPPGSYQVTTALSVTSRVTILGAGYQGDSGQNNIGGSGSYNTAGNITAGSGWLGSTLICGVLNNCISIATNNAVALEKFQITYPVRAGAGITGIAAAAASGGTSNNTASTFRDIFISGADIAISLTNFINFTIDHCTLAPWTTSVQISVPNYGSFGDSTIVNSTMYGRNIVQHILATSIGGLRIENNKLVSGSVGIFFSATLIGNQYEPTIITGNSLEGQGQGIVAQQQGSSTTQASQFVITGNQIFVGAFGINWVVGTGSTVWLTGFTITGNTIVTAASTAVNIQLDGVQQGVITGNYVGNSVAGGSGIVLGAHATNTNVQSNAYNPTITTKVTNGGGTSNTVAGAASWLLKRDLDPASNDNTPMWLRAAA